MDVKREDVIIIWLTLQLIILSAMYARVLAKASYLQGQMDIYNSFKADGTEGTCYVKGGCAP